MRNNLLEAPSDSLDTEQGWAPMLEALAVALDRLPTAALIVSEGLEVACVNRQAADFLDATETVCVVEGELVLDRDEEARALHSIIAEACALAVADPDVAMPTPQVVGISRQPALPLDVLAVPLRPRRRPLSGDTYKPRVLLLIYDPAARPHIDALLVERLFGLTSTEALVAARLAEGLSSAQIAAERECSTATVRTHIKRILRKTHTNRQAELVQLILTSPAISFEG